jgi:ABC-2 type transport system permease protein
MMARAPETQGGTGRAAMPHQSLVNAALWEKALREALWLLMACAALMFVFHWLRVWIASQYTIDDMTIFMARFVKNRWFERLMPIPFDQLITREGRLGLAYSEPMVLVIMSVWGIARGSAAISGEIDRGTMEMLLAQPVRRTEIVLSQAVVTAAGAGVIALAAWGGTAAGLAVIGLDGPVRIGRFGLAALNLFALGFFVAGLTTLVSAPDRYRRRTIGLAATVVILAQIIEVVALGAEGWERLRYATFFTAFKPATLVTSAEPWSLALQQVGVLAALGLASYVAAVTVFRRRDLPAPL